MKQKNRCKCLNHTDIDFIEFFDIELEINFISNVLQFKKLHVFMFLKTSSDGEPFTHTMVMADCS